VVKSAANSYPGFTDAQLRTLRTRLVRWYEQEFRNLPWRLTDDPYKIWVSEVMLQQTQVKKVVPFYRRFLRQFPTVHALAGANLSEILKAWEGLGYYARARNLHKAAKQIVAEYDGRFPDDMSVVRKLPGIGPYTAAAVLSISFNRNYAVLDGNVSRVLCRMVRYPQSPKTTEGKKELLEIAQFLLDRKHPGIFNQAMIELGATVCKPTTPLCSQCPIADFCQSKQYSEQKNFPIKLPTRARPHHIIAAGIIVKGDKILIALRPENGFLGGLWEFPGGKVEDGESLEEAVVREVEEEVAVKVQVKNLFATIEHQYSHFTITLNAFICQYISGTPKTLGCEDWRWVRREELKEYAFPRANGKIIEGLLKYNLTSEMISTNWTEDKQKRIRKG